MFYFPKAKTARVEMMPFTQYLNQEGFLVLSFQLLQSISHLKHVGEADGMIRPMLATEAKGK